MLFFFGPHFSHPRDTVSHYAVVHFSVSNRLNRTFHDISGKSMWTPPWRCNFVSGREVTPICVVKLRPTQHGVFANWVVLRPQSGKCCLDGMTLCVTFASKTGWISWMWLVHFKISHFRVRCLGLFIIDSLTFSGLCNDVYCSLWSKICYVSLGFPAMSCHAPSRLRRCHVPFQPLQLWGRSLQKTPKGSKGLDTLHVSSHLFCLKDPTN